MKKYPIYNFDFKWEENGDHDFKYPEFNKGLPEGRVHNGCNFNRMFKDDQTLKELNEYSNKWWDENCEKNIDKNIQLESMSISFVEKETWLLTWFCHVTIDDGQTDEEVLESFENFVSRKEELGRDVYCLMGAGDRWRWCGENENSPAPCRCQFCKEKGVIRIGH